MGAAKTGAGKLGAGLFAGALTAAVTISAFVVPTADAQSNRRAERGPSVLGNYLAGRIARGTQDTESAAEFYRKALTRDPKNDLLIEQSFAMEVSEGQWERAIPLADKLAAIQPTHRMARLMQGLAAFKAGRLADADEHFKAANANPIGELTATLARAWLRQAQGNTKEALDLLEQPKQPEWAQFFLRYHRALIADMAGRRQEARAAFDRIYKADQRTLRVALAFAQHAGNNGDFKLAQQILQSHLDKSRGEGHPMARALANQLEQGLKPQPLIVNPSDGMAEAFYGLGEALSGEGGVSIGAIYLQYALYLNPQFPFALATLANVYETTKRYEDAVATYDRIPKGTPLETSIEIRKALNLNQLERVDDAKKVLETIHQRDPADIKPLDALGSIMRGHKRHAEAIEYYSRAIALIDKPQPVHWSYFYARGTSYERLKKWPQAEADLQRALKLSPDQPLVLNYLGYSWIDQGKNLKQGMALIEKAVRLKPDDGYIVDSLGWAHYKMGNFKEAVKHLEKAVELRPDDPVLNDHLGDSLWRVGREREARFQWEQALTLKPEPEDEERIRKKLSKGLAAPAQARVQKRTREAERVEQPRKRTENRAVPVQSPFLQ
jgi:tetratricopeptide (TPR) repeat protein